MATVLKGRYRIQEKIGEGGMAEVYLGEDERLGRRVVLKVLRDHLAKDGEFIERFDREAKAEANLTHPNIVNIHDFDEDGGTHFIVMEYIEGARSLADVIKGKGRLTEKEAYPIAKGVLEALSFAHESGIIHRDLKPANVLVLPDGRVKVTDFGLAKALRSESLTQTGAMMGTVQYLSPEQAQGKSVGLETDLYAMGIMLFEMLTGSLPFEGDNPVTIALKQVQESPPPVRQVNPELSAAVERLLERALRKNPADRFSHAGEFLTELTRAVESPAALPPQRAVQAQSVVAEKSPHEEPQPPASRNMSLIFALVVIAVVSLFAGFYLSVNPFQQVEVPRLKDMTINKAQALVDEKGLHVRIKDEVYEGGIPEGTIIDQEPSPGSHVRMGSTVLVVVSRGAQMVEVPSLVGKTREEALASLRFRGLSYMVEKEAYSGSFPKDCVVSQRPAAETQAPVKSVIYLTLSKGQLMVKMPDITGRSHADAAKALAALGLKLAVDGSEYSPDVPKGEIIRQTPGAGEETPKGDAVRAVLSLGPEVLIAPQLVGKSIAEARDFLEGRRMVLIPEGVADSDAMIVSQDPPAGQSFTGGQIRVKAEKTPAVTPTAAEETVTVPSVTGRTQQEAADALEQAGLRAGAVTEEESSEEKGKVIRQVPAADQSARRGTAVDLVVSSGKP